MKAGRILAGAAALALLAGGAWAQSVKDYPEVADGSFTEANGNHVLKLSLVIPADRKAVWARFTTTEGYKAWATPMAKVDFGLNGLIEASYDDIVQRYFTRLRFQGDDQRTSLLQVLS